MKVMVLSLTECVSLDFSLAKNSVLENRRETLPFILSIKGECSSSPPITVLFVIDTSYSMDGEKIFRAKQSALKILTLLRDIDYVGVYGFHDNFYKVLEPTKVVNRRVVEKAIVDLKLGSGTNIYDVFDKLVDEVSFINNNLKTPIRLIFLTDGQPTTGPKKIDKIMNAVSRLVDKNISSLIIGVGEDYNENLLLKIAKTLNGVFEHIDKPESLEKIMYDYIAFTREISARNTKLIIRLNPGFNLVVYNRKYDLKQDGIVVDIGEVNYGELINIVGDIETPPLTIGLAKVGDIQLSYVNPANGRIEVSSPISIEIRVSSREELSAASVSESVLMKSRLIKIASQIEKDIEKGVSKDLIRELENIAEITMKIGDEELASKTISIREKIIESGLTPSLSKEIASIVSRILSGKTRIKRGEESSGEHGE